MYRPEHVEFRSIFRIRWWSPRQPAWWVWALSAGTACDQPFDTRHPGQPTFLLRSLLLGPLANLSSFWPWPCSDPVERHRVTKDCTSLQNCLQMLVTGRKREREIERAHTVSMWICQKWRNSLTVCVTRESLCAPSPPPPPKWADQAFPACRGCDR